MITTPPTNVQTDAAGNFTLYLYSSTTVSIQYNLIFVAGGCQGLTGAGQGAQVGPVKSVSAAPGSTVNLGTISIP